jgi:hypothetical protein
MLVTDSPYHYPGDGSGSYPGPTYAETITEISNADVHVITLIGPSPGGDYSSLASDTGGSVQPISADSSDIVGATLAALEEIKTDVWWEKGTIDPEISISFDKDVVEDVTGGDLVYFTETITADSCALAGDYDGEVAFFANTYPTANKEIGTQEVTVTVLPNPVSVDIQPLSCPNAFNTKQKGEEPVAIPGTADFDVTTIDPATVKLNGVSPIRWTYEDVTTPYIGTDRCGCWQEGPDGYMDLVLHYDSIKFAKTLSHYTVKGDPVRVGVTGDTECASIEGFDCVWVVK